MATMCMACCIRPAIYKRIRPPYWVVCSDVCACTSALRVGAAPRAVGGGALKTSPLVGARQDLVVSADCDYVIYEGKVLLQQTYERLPEDTFLHVGQNIIIKWYTTGIIQSLGAPLETGSFRPVWQCIVDFLVTRYLSTVSSGDGLLCLDVLSAGILGPSIPGEPISDLQPLIPRPAAWVATAPAYSHFLGDWIRDRMRAWREAHESPSKRQEIKDAILRNLRYIFRLLNSIHGEGIVHGDLRLETVVAIIPPPRKEAAAAAPPLEEVLDWRLINFGRAHTSNDPNVIWDVYEKLMRQFGRQPLLRAFLDAYPRRTENEFANPPALDTSKNKEWNEQIKRIGEAIQTPATPSVKIFDLFNGKFASRVWYHQTRSLLGYRAAKSPPGLNPAAQETNVFFNLVCLNILRYLADSETPIILAENIDRRDRLDLSTLSMLVPPTSRTIELVQLFIELAAPQFTSPPRPQASPQPPQVTFVAQAGREPVPPGLRTTPVDRIPQEFIDAMREQLRVSIPADLTTYDLTPQFRPENPWMTQAFDLIESDYREYIRLGGVYFDPRPLEGSADTRLSAINITASDYALPVCHQGMCRSQAMYEVLYMMLQPLHPGDDMDKWVAHPHGATSGCDPFPPDEVLHEDNYWKYSHDPAPQVNSSYNPETDTDPEEGPKARGFRHLFSRNRVLRSGEEFPDAPARRLGLRLNIHPDRVDFVDVRSARLQARNYMDANYYQCNPTSRPWGKRRVFFAYCRGVGKMIQRLAENGSSACRNTVIVAIDEEDYVSQSLRTINKKLSHDETTQYMANAWVEQMRRASRYIKIER